MGLEVLFWIWVLTWMAKRSAEDVLHAVKGTPNPRYELKRERAVAAGQQPKRQPQYGGREWFADLFSDALAANTEKRRKAAKAKSQPVDDMVDVVRESRPAPAVRHETPEPAPQPQPEPEPESAPEAPVVTDTRPTARIIQFPNPKNIEKEITMANSEVTGLSTAIAFAEAAASAHSSFASGGSEGYTGALAAHDVGEGCIGSAMEAQEASGVAAAKWAKHREDLAAQMNVKEAYQGTPDAGNREFLLNG